jgi:putative ABC transport system permease protein
MFALLRKVWRDLAQRRVRSALTILGIAVGVAGLVAITSTSSNVARAQREVFDATSQADITYWVWDAPTRLAATLSAYPRIAAAELRLTHVARWRAGASWMDIELVGLDDFARVRINQFELLKGRFPSTGEIVLEVSASRAGGVEVGSKIAYRDQGGRERYLTVSGISASPSYLSSSITKVAVGYVPAPFLRRMLSTSGNNQLLIKLRDPQDAQATAQYIGRLLRQQGLQAGAPEIRHPDQFPGKRELDALMVMMFLFSAMGLVLSSLLVINTLSASVAEQINEIAILKTIGATRRQVLLVYLLEALAYGVIGTPLGIVAGAIGGWRLLAWIGTLGNAPVRFRLAPQGLALGLFVGLGVSLLAGLIPALQGMRISIREALESYGIHSDYGQGWLARQLQHLSHLPPLVSMALRNPSRRRTRTALTLLVIALSTAAFLAAAATRDSVESAISDIYTTYYADAWVWLDRAVSSQFEESFLAVKGVYAAEGWVIANGIAKLAEARLWGLPPESTLYRQVMREGRWLRGDEPDAVVLSTELADAQDVRVGERIEIQAQGQPRTFTVVGIAVDNTIFLGGQLAGKAFLPRATLARMLGQEDSVNIFALGIASRERRIADDILADVELKFRHFGPSVQPVYAEIESAREASRLLTLGLAAMVVIVALVGALGILNTLTLNVSERRREIAVMRAVGATDAALVLSFLTEGLVLGALGWLLGFFIGYPSGRLFTGQLSRVLFALRFVLSARAVLASAAFTLGLAIASSLVPALGAAHTSSSAALHYE